MSKLLPAFCPCVICEDLHERDKRHVVREGHHVVVIPEDEEYEWCGFTACHEHYATYRRLRPVGADVIEEGEHATH